MCRLIDRINTFTGTIAAWMIIPLIATMCFEVAARYVFGAPTIWAFELSYLLTGSMWLLGLAYTLSQGAHIRIDMFYANMPIRLQAFIDVSLFVFLILPFLLWLTATLDDRMVTAFRSGEKTGQSAWNPPIWPFRAVFFVSFLVLCLQVIGEVYRRLPVLFGSKAKDQS